MKSRLFLVIWRIARVTIDTDMTVSWAKMLCYSNCCFTHHRSFATIVSVSIITPARCPINFKWKLVGKHKGIQKVLEESHRGLEVWCKWRDLNLAERKKRFPSWAGAEKICSGFEFQQKKQHFCCHWSTILPDCNDQPMSSTLSLLLSWVKLFMQFRPN